MTGHRARSGFSVLETIVARTGLRAASARPEAATRRAIVLAPRHGTRAILDPGLVASKPLHTAKPDIGLEPMTLPAIEPKQLTE